MKEKLGNEVLTWPYPLEYSEKEKVETDILILGGGIAGCFAAISAARRGLKVVLVEKGATIRSGAGGSGADHWESAATNPCSQITPEELTLAMIENNGGYCNGISHYIECREGWDRLLDLEKMGAKIRDEENQFQGAEFRDEETKLLFAYDYRNKFNIRIWGSTYKPILFRECKRLGVKVVDRIMATALLMERKSKGRRAVGALGLNTRTGKLMIFSARATILCMSRPSRIWLFSAPYTGISEFRPFQCAGDGHAMGWRAGVEFAMMEKSVRAEWSGEKSFPPYGTGNSHNTWYACSMVDARGRDIPWVDRDGYILNTVSQRYYPTRDQRFFLKGGGEPAKHLYKFQGPEIMALEKLLKRNFELPFYADLPGMPPEERKVIWGMMIGEEGKTKVPILQSYTRRGFNPDIHLLQSYGEGWTSAEFKPDERQFFGLPGGVFNDWQLRTNITGLFAAGDMLFASNCYGHAAATGDYAGRQAAKYARDVPITDLSRVEKQIIEEQKSYRRIINRKKGINWQTLNSEISSIMQNYCGEIKDEQNLSTGLKKLREQQNRAEKKLTARNPHELMRCLEVMNILTNARIVILASLVRKASSAYLHFNRSDYPDKDSEEWNKFITLRLEKKKVIYDDYPLDYYGSLTDNYVRYNHEYIKENRS